MKKSKQNSKSTFKRGDRFFRISLLRPVIQILKDFSLLNSQKSTVGLYHGRIGEILARDLRGYPWMNI